MKKSKFIILNILYISIIGIILFFLILSIYFAVGMNSPRALQPLDYIRANYTYTIYNFNSSNNEHIFKNDSKITISFNKPDTDEYTYLVYYKENDDIKDLYIRFLNINEYIQELNYVNYYSNEMCEFTYKLNDKYGYFNVYSYSHKYELCVDYFSENKVENINFSVDTN